MTSSPWEITTELVLITADVTTSSIDAPVGRCGGCSYPRRVSTSRQASARAQVPPFEVMRILHRVAQLRAEGRSVISLCAGEPAGGAPGAVHRRAAQLHRAQAEFSYTPALGIEELREEIAAHYRLWYGLRVPTEAVAVTTGSSGGFLLAFLAAFNPGDRVALARPGYPAYRNLLTALGCEVVELDCGPEVGFQPTPTLLDDAVAASGELAGLVLASPANPTGTMIDVARMAALVEWSRRRGVQIVSDEIYHGITYGHGSPEASGDPERPKGVCALALEPDAIVVSSFSKYWGMTGWRVGWLILPERLRAPVDALAGNIALCPPAPAQAAAVAAFRRASYAEADTRVAELARVREIALAGARRLGWDPIAPADGAFYLYAGVPLGQYEDSEAWCAALLETHGVALVPGTDFDRVDGREFVRLSFAAGAEAVTEALERIEAFQAS
ncbi:aminotransferase class I/II-fold pyridoxal phosphate-dependent enzyme [Pseudactinotalea sp. HY160]|nr:aminotransferase class I/II-fold pyridoxal phosphate-dependent enzyme [Pseudactinotalea sp. HY160]